MRAAQGLIVRGGTALIEGEMRLEDVIVADGRVRIDRGGVSTGLAIDATGLLVLPGLVDVHGDAFERQMMPRPGVDIDIGLALVETDRQLVANGITTAFHGVTRSWEPGLRDAANARRLLSAIETLRGELAADTRFHLRHETYNLEGEDEIVAWIAERRIDVVAFNDHMTGTIKVRHRPDKMRKMVERSGLDAAAFDALVERVSARADEVAGSIARLAAAAQSAGVPTMSHDDMDVAQRRWFAALGVGVAEFPMTEAVAEAAIADGAPTVFGAPNVLRGGSHTGCPDAAQMARQGLCSVLSSDYFYPALLQAPFILARRHEVPFADAWALVSENAAAAVCLADRGVLRDGFRGDVVVVDARNAARPVVVATIAAGRLVHLADGALLTAA